MIHYMSFSHLSLYYYHGQAKQAKTVNPKPTAPAATTAVPPVYAEAIAILLAAKSLGWYGVYCRQVYQYITYKKEFFYK